jgi:amino acid adenylation domain-containing protein/non-ribosomal peptide synthase protein (TIGR01720 family)
MLQFKNLIQVIEKNAREDKGITFITQNKEEYISYKRLYHRALHVLYNLQQQGLEVGDEVIFQVVKDDDFLYNFWACILGGFIPVPMPPAINEEQRSKLFRIWKILKNPHLITTKKIIGTLSQSDDAEIKYLLDEIYNNTIFVENLTQEIEEGIIYKCSQEDVAFIQFSSGSTGDPKGVILTHENLVSNLMDTIKNSESSKEDSALSWMPLTHDMGLIGFHINPLTLGINQYVMATMEFLQNPLLWIEKLYKYKATVTACPNFGYNHFLKFYDENIDYGWDLSKVKLIFNGAEPINVEVSNRFLDIMEKYKLKRTVMFPVYGMAEATLAVSFPPPKEELIPVKVNRRHLAVGAKIQACDETNRDCVSFVDLGYGVGCNIRICDDNDEILGENRVGNIQLKGSSLTKGYYNNIKATEKLFTKDSWLRTGDLGFLREDRLTVTGRAKDIIFINSQNYYPIDIEKIVEKVTGVRFGTVAACGVFNEQIQKDEILIFISTEEELKEFYNLSVNIKRCINKEMGLEVEMVLPIKALPKTSSGKVQRYKLGTMYQNNEFSNIIVKLNKIKEEVDKDRNIDEPTNETEEKIVRIWSKILKQDKIGVSESFFELGGDSLKATYVIHEINKLFNTNVKIVDLFNETTIKELAKFIEVLDSCSMERIEPVNMQEYYPLSSAQKRIFILNNMEKCSTAYNMPQVISIEGTLDIERLKVAFAILIKRHESLRTTFCIVDGQPFQKIVEDINFDIKIINSLKGDFIKNHTEGNVNFFQNIVKKYIIPFDLRKAPLMRVVIINEDEKRYNMILDIHHIISDGTSMGVFIKELMCIYNGMELEPLRIQYKDYAAWHNKEIKSKVMDIQRAYWLDKFKEESQVINLPTDYLRPAVQSFQGNTIKFNIDEELTKKLKKLGNRVDSSLYMVLLSAYSVLLSKYSGEEDIIVGTVAAGRNHIDVQDIIGMFVNTLGMRSYPKGDKTYSELLSEVKEECLKSFEYQDYQFEQLVSDLGITRDLSRNPLFDTMFVMENMELPEMKLGDTYFKSLDYKNNISKFDLTLFAMEFGKELHLSYEYSTRLFREDTILRATEHYINILEQITSNVDVKICDIDILNKEEKKTLLVDFNNTYAEYPKHKTIQELFETQVEKTPDKVAVIYESQRITYRELNEKANKLAFTLREKGICREDRVAILTERNGNTLAAILGVLKAGGAYIPIDSSYPKDRIQYILEDSNAKVLLTEHGINDKVKIHIETLCLEDEHIYSDHKENLNIINTPKDLTYIIYTSGSTGKPKGVMVEQQGLVNYIYWAVKSYVKSEEDVFPLFTTISFDLTVTSIFTPLLSGNTIIIYNDDEKSMSIEKVIRENKCTVVKLTPAHLKLIKSFDNSKSSIKRFIVGGEELETELAKEVYNSFNGKIEICNEYGPTETVVGCMIHVYDINKDVKKGVPIGVPSDNVKIYVLDKYLKPTALSVPGEMYISGDGVARGYINRDDLTKEKFIESPFEKGQRIYKTGDLARWISNGTIEYFGRIDDQVKIRGFRIEIGEIQSQLLKHNHIKDAVVLVKERENGDKYICAYFVSDEELTVNKLRTHLSIHLPEYMMPSYFIQVDKMPLTHNGKVDKKALPKPEEYTLCTGEEYVAATTDETNIMAEIWAEVLGLEKVGINDNYFALGGDSIKAIQIVSKLRELGINLNVKDILVHQTIDKLCSNVDSSIKGKEHYQGIVEGNLSLTPIQHWFMDQNFSNASYYNQSVLLRFKKLANIELLEEAFKKLIRHHDALRLNYNSAENKMFFNNDLINSDFIIETFDVSALKEEEQLREIESFGTRVKGNLNINAGALIKAAIIKREKDELLLITAHHLLVDGVSWRIVLEDLVNIYEAIEQGEKINIPLKTSSLVEWNEKLMEYSRNHELLSEKELWTNMEYDDFKLPLDFEEKGTQQHRNKVRGQLKEEITTVLLSGANKPYNTQINHLLITALYKTVAQWTGQKRITVEMEGHGRNLEDVDLSRTVGWFTAMYPVSLEVSSEGIGENIKEIKEQMMKIPNNGVGYGILKYVSEENYVSQVSEIRFNYLGQFDKEVDNKLFSISNIYTGEESDASNSMTTKIDINCMVVNGVFTIEIGFNRNQYKIETLENFKDNYLMNLKAIATHTLKENKVYYTPSDFKGCKLEQRDIDSLFVGDKELKAEEVEDIIPLTSLQEKMLNCYKKNPNSEEYFVQISLNLEGSIDAQIFKKAWQVVIESNDILRTVYRWENLSNSVQIVLENHEVPIRVQDFSNLDKDMKSIALSDMKAQDIKEAIDLSTAPFRLTLCKLSDKAWELVISNHHIIYDGWSNGIILKEFIEVYKSLLEGKTPTSLSKAQFKDFIVYTEKQNKCEEEAYWKGYLRGYNKKVLIPRDNNPKELPIVGRNYVYSLSEDITKELESFCKERRITQASLYYTAWGMLLGKYSSKDDVVFGTITSGRKAKVKGIEEIVGLCMNTIPLRMNMKEDANELLQSVNENLKLREEFENTPFKDIKSYSELKDEESLFDSAVIVENYPLDEKLKGNGGIFKVKAYEAFELMSYDITIQIMTFGDTKVKFIYNESLFKASTIEAMAEEYYKTLIEAVNIEAMKVII